jgi:hypothetical protein
MLRAPNGFSVLAEFLHSLDLLKSLRGLVASFIPTPSPLAVMGNIQFQVPERNVNGAGFSPT